MRSDARESPNDARELPDDAREPPNGDREPSGDARKPLDNARELPDYDREPSDSGRRSLGGEIDTAAPTDRASTTVLALVLLVALTAAVAGVVGAATLEIAAEETGEPPPTAALAFSVEGDRLTFTHRTGETLDVRRLRLLIRVDDEPLAHQPKLPFFSAHGFRAGPTGPFNVAEEPAWEVGETASLRVAGTNRPQLTPESRVTATVYAGEQPIARLSARVEKP